jgi:hypothetical protein
MAAAGEWHLPDRRAVRDGPMEGLSMSKTVRHVLIHRRRCPYALAVALACGVATPAFAEVSVEGTAESVRVTTARDPISDVLSALATFNVRYRTAIPLDKAAQTSYSGSVREVLFRLLDGYNYVIRRNQQTTEVIVLGGSGQVAIPPPAPKVAPAKSVLSQWR